MLKAPPRQDIVQWNTTTQHNRMVIWVSARSLCCVISLIQVLGSLIIGFVVEIGKYVIDMSFCNLIIIITLDGFALLFTHCNQSLGHLS